jgi:hypothetical protein
MNKNIIAFVRPDDFTVFSINNNGTFSLHTSKTEYPDALHSEYSYENLQNLGFHEVFNSVNKYTISSDRNCGDDE